jgi:hypothetical protein
MCLLLFAGTGHFIEFFFVGPNGFADFSSVFSRSGWF